MSQPILQLQNTANWTQIWQFSATAQPAPDRPSGYLEPIPTVVMPFLLEDRIVAFAANSATAKDTWRLAGYVNRKVATGITVGGSPDSRVDDSKRIFLRENTVLFFEQVAPTYQLEITIPWYFQDINLVLFAYRGIDTDTITAQLNRIEQTLLT